MLRDTWLIFDRELRFSLRNPTWIGIQIMQPVLYLVLFGPLMERVVASTPGFPPGDVWTIFTPALIVMIGLFGTAFVGFGLLADYRNGVVERLRVTPASRVALLLGKVGNNVLQAVVQASLLIVLAVLVFGLRASLAGVLLSLLIAALLAVTMASASYALALTLKSEHAFPALLNALLLPLLLLSGILLPITTGLAPDWLYTLSRINPFSHVVEAERAAFRGDFTMDSLLTGSIVLVVLAALTVFWGTRKFRMDNA
ncbi:multidrug ABC transporter permease [Prauserella marina]|uniref:Transport permease protein n=1 Tax=Prauserella marina TaxID=530584 RepID=A0A222VVY5_9PSEU|nr:ABC transporter permease [Prauserella marina]ASR38064.1 multidrug ABC transporter permease [Prauserella marina]PWV73308.1 ABC-2 type transport system permease protein [Prauserella marina]SDD66739.1 ABC-2 type transport system permease protein [Prauserella marina]